ncbi:DUF3570 domain-containing protein [Massilia sp. W12]|uniref:DUF3570 domain-containing protein n=1 Tax=Massilia sp. W12 TaxID=3126507 RepID=UPI0030CAB236
MVATEGAAARLLAAALALPGIAAPVQAEEAPEQASMSLHWLDYRDRQPGFSRVHVRVPAINLTLPLGSAWSLQANVMQDAVSGASPRYHTAVSSASHFEEERRAADLTITRHFARGSLALQLGRSGENDYVSRFAAIQGKWANENQNRTLLFGTSLALDEINPVNGVAKNQSKRQQDFLLGLTQIMTERDLLQVSFTRSLGQGYYSDPYKRLDFRPRTRNASILMLRWNHQFGAPDDKLAPTLRTSWRYFGDSFGVRSHTLHAEWVQPLGAGWQITPSLRYYNQGAAEFYADAVYDPKLKAPFPLGLPVLDLLAGKLNISLDQRLAAFGALGAGLLVEKELPGNWHLQAGVEYYRQRSDWAWFNHGSVNLDPFSSLTWQFGVRKSW